jgi:hypothetical protein
MKTTERVFDIPKLGKQVFDYGFTEELNPRYRRTMEVHICI